MTLNEFIDELALVDMTDWEANYHGFGIRQNYRDRYHCPISAVASNVLDTSYFAGNPNDAAGALGLSDRDRNLIKDAADIYDSRYDRTLRRRMLDALGLED